MLKSDINSIDQNDVKVTLKINNNIKVNHVTSFIKKLRNLKASIQSIIIFTENSKEVNDLICEELRVKDRYYAVKRYASQCQIKQCFKCQEYEHKAKMCTKKSRCEKCAQKHEIQQCNKRKIKCAYYENLHAT